jgi:hypothetical protein
LEADIGKPPLCPEAVLGFHAHDGREPWSGVCKKCFADAQAAGDPLDYLAKYYRDLWPDMQLVNAGSA